MLNLYLQLLHEVKHALSEHYYTFYKTHREAAPYEWCQENVLDRVVPAFFLLKGCAVWYEGCGFHLLLSLLIMTFAWDLKVGSQKACSE